MKLKSPDLVKVGDKVEAEQSLITVEGDKASMEVRLLRLASLKIKVSVGDKTETGKLIMIFDSADGAAAAAAERRKKLRPPLLQQLPRQRKKLTCLTSVVTKLKSLKSVKVGDTVAAEQSLITVEGDKASMEVRRRSRAPLKIKINTGDKVSTGSLIMIFEVAGAAPAAAPAQAAAPAPAAAPAAGGVKDVNVPDIGGDEVEVTEVMVKVGDKVAAERH